MDSLLLRLSKNQSLTLDAENGAVEIVDLPEGSMNQRAIDKLREQNRELLSFPEGSVVGLFRPSVVADATGDPMRAHANPYTTIEKKEVNPTRDPQFLSKRYAQRK